VHSRPCETAICPRRTLNIQQVTRYDAIALHFIAELNTEKKTERRYISHRPTLTTHNQKQSESATGSAPRCVGGP